MMVELPEVETVVRQLDHALKNQVVSDIDFRMPNKQTHLNKMSAALKGKKLIQVRRKGTNVILDFSENQSLLAHLDVDGQLQCVSHSANMNADTSVIFKFKDSDKELRLGDVQRFSFLKLLETKSIESAEPIKGMGKEPLQISVKDFRDTLNLNPNRNIRALLMDQSLIVGIGNVYADEVLFRAKIHPSEKVKNIPFPRLDKLHHAIYHILELAILHGGTHVQDFVRTADQPETDGFDKLLQVYQRDGQECLRCKREKIQKVKVSSKVAYVCSYCQPLRYES